MIPTRQIVENSQKRYKQNINSKGSENRKYLALYWYKGVRLTVDYNTIKFSEISISTHKSVHSCS